MNEDEINRIVYSKNVIEFVTVANEYCNFIEDTGRFKTSQALSVAQKLLPLVYLKTTLLPEIGKVLDEEIEKYVTELDYNLLLQKWAAKLGGNDGFREVFVPGAEFSEEAIEASISENLLDIYQNLKDFISSYSLGNEEVMNDALSECIFQFKEYWGQRLANVLRAIHHLMVSDIDLDGELDQKTGMGNNDEPGWVDSFFDQFRKDNL